MSSSVVPVWSFGDRARKIRRDVLKVDQQGFARLLGVTAQAAGAWESRNAQPRDVVAIARRIELLTGVPASWTLGLDEAAAVAVQPAAAAESITQGDLAAGSARRDFNRHWSTSAGRHVATVDAPRPWRPRCVIAARRGPALLAVLGRPPGRPAAPRERRTAAGR